MNSTVSSAALFGVEGHAVAVEVHSAAGMPGFTIVGLPDAACREARDRVRAALLSSGLAWSQKRVTVNLAPSHIRKTGAGLDVAIAIGFLVATEQLGAADVEGVAFLGELGLDGSLRPIDGIVPLVDAVDDRAVVVPSSVVAHALLPGRHVVRGVDTLGELVSCLKNQTPWPEPPIGGRRTEEAFEPDLADVRGQPLARWALEVAAAGGHNLLMTGAPGSGKTMLARRLSGLLPDLDPRTSLECTKVHSAAGVLADDAALTRPPLRAPHHTSSMVSIVGGGTAIMRPGEVSLSHGGVLFLDEMAEFAPSVLDTLRQPLEEGVVRIARARASVSFPARFLLVGATNPCPCGEAMTPEACRCPPTQRTRYAARLSGPMRDRIDLRVNVHRPRVEHFFEAAKGESTATVAARVAAARARAVERAGMVNSLLGPDAIERFAPLDHNAEALLRHQMRVGALTARGLFRVRRVALTLCDLQGAAVLNEEHVSAALQLRPEPPRAEAA